MRSIYLVNDAVKTVMTETDYTKMRLISAGVKAFGRSDLSSSKPSTSIDGADPKLKVQFRILNEGMHAVLPYIDPCTFLEGDVRILRTLLEAYYPLSSSFEDPFRSAIEARCECSKFHSGYTVECQYLRSIGESYYKIWPRGVWISKVNEHSPHLSSIYLTCLNADLTTM